VRSSKTDSKTKNDKPGTTPIAIIGISAIFPKASNKQEYWDNILNKIDAVTEVPPSRWNIDDYYDPDPRAEDKSYCKLGGFIPDIDFDPAEFGLPPNLLEATDVTQLLSLVTARDCLEDAGYGDEAKCSRENVGVILGMVGIGSKLVIPLMARLQYPVWDKVMKSYGIADEDRTAIIEKIKLAYPRWEENSFPGSIGNVVAGRIANRFNLGGTNCVVDAACGSSLAAIRMATDELIEGRADMMITGGVDLDNSIGAYLCFSKTPAFSKGEHVRTFDQETDGMMVGEGLGMVMLKRLEDAERDGDRIYAVIKGIGTSSDGRYKSIYAPRPYGQSLALRRAYAEAEVNPSTVGLIEAHGTGTMAGDPAELEGLNTFFSETDTEKQHIALGSVKSQIAHTKAAAGVASLIKVAMALHSKVLPATINVSKPNPKLGLENSSFYINTEVRPWFRENNTPRRAGVSGFGFGGTNFHVVLEESEAEQEKPYRIQPTPRMVLLSAPTPDELIGNIRKWITSLTSTDSNSSFVELVNSSNSGAIPENHCRVGFITLDKNEALTKLQQAEDLIKSKGQDESAEHPAGIFYRKLSANPEGKLVALFPGQGSQYLNMGIELARNFPEVRQAFQEMNTLFEKGGQKPVTDVVYPIPVFDDVSRNMQSKKVTETEFAQPAIGTFSVGLYKMLQKAGFKPSFTAGHSFGELTSLWAAGVYSEEDYFFLAKSRGKAMAPPAEAGFDAGTMLAVKGDVEKVRKELESFPEVTLANWNSNSQVVLAGARQAIEAIQKVLSEKGYSVVPLDVSAAFHTPLVGHAQKPFAAAIDQIQFKKPGIKTYSNTSGEMHPSDIAQIKKTLAGHILNPVLFKNEIEAIYNDGGSIFVEIGPKNVLTNLVNNILEGKPHVAIALNPNAKKDSDRQFREAVIQMRVLGLDLENVDPYALDIRQKSQKKSAISLKLNGGLYLSDKTRDAFQKAISESHALHLPENMENVRVAIPVQQMTGNEKLENHVPSVNDTSNIQVLLDQVGSIQKEIVQVHHKFLENDADFSRIFSNLTDQELNLVKSNSAPAALEQINTALQTLDRSLSQFHQHQVETTRIHEQYLKNQHEMVTLIISLTQGTSAKNLTVAPKQEATELRVTPEMIVKQENRSTASGSNGPGNGNNGHNKDLKAEVTVSKHEEHSATPVLINQQALKESLLAIVSEKTGYPSEMLDLAMDMEADLGIDSIKRVEILGAMQEKFPNLPQIDPAALSDMHSLGQIVSYMTDSSEKSGLTSNVVPDNKPSTPENLPNVSTSSESSSVSLEDVKKALLSIVSEKTGYPIEMLEIGMDMEADLGIDSIKRVEILGAMQEKFPELPQVDPSMLSDMRTLGQIIDQLSSSSKTAMTQSVAAQVPERIVTLAKPVVEQKSESSIVENEDLSKTLLSIVSEKTGYPVEMLEPDMDLEADLGIDSIKRVEILGAMQERYPELPQADPAHLSEMRTLQQIIDVLSGSKMSASEPEPSDIDLQVSVQSETEELSKGYLNLKTIPFPDRLAIEIPDGAVTLLTDDGSDLTVNLAKNLCDLGHKVAILKLAGSNQTSKLPMPESVSRINLADNTEGSLSTALQDVQSRMGRVAVFIHLDPDQGDSKRVSGQEKSVVKTVFLLAKLLKEDLTAYSRDGFAAFMAVTHLDGQFGLSMSNLVEPISGGLFGLTKTLGLEWDSVFCRSLDLQPGIPSTRGAEIIVSELSDPNRLLSEVAYTKTERFTTVVDLPELEGVA
jgi:acyl transferase domain-containing protein